MKHRIQRYAAGAFLAVGMINGVEAFSDTSVPPATQAEHVEDQPADSRTEYLGTAALSLALAGYLVISANNAERREDQISEILQSAADRQF
jgi:hypothetical protein